MCFSLLLLEVQTGFEPMKNGFADRRFNHSATEPIGAGYYYFIPRF